MAEKTGISWTDSTFNPWIGCTKVSPGCDHCYAEALDARHRWNGAMHWGIGVPRMRTSASNWKAPLAWNKKAAASGKRHLVFCASLADVFDNEVPEQWRSDLFDLIANTDDLTWLLLTKRIGNVAKMLPDLWHAEPWENVWLGASVVNQEEADRDIPKLVRLPAAKRFVSYEPALGPIDLRPWLREIQTSDPKNMFAHSALDWVIVGGESAQGGAKARPFDLAWARSAVEQCRADRVPCFVKQLGSQAMEVPPGKCAPWEKPGQFWRLLLRDRAGADPAEWPVDLRVQEFP